jgi:hypothetical protein
MLFGEPIFNLILLSGLSSGPLLQLPSLLLIAPAFYRYAPAEDVRLEAEPKILLSVCRGRRGFSAVVGVSGNSTIVGSLCRQLKQKMSRTCSQ